jgi:hypothetical protein
MPDRRSLYAILGDLALTSPMLVLMRNREYFRIEDLWRLARKDWKKTGPLFQDALSAPIYWTETDDDGKLLLKGVTQKGDEFVSFVEAGSDIPTDPV